MRILFIASEVAPFSKTGGLGDVCGALPAALSQLGHELLVVSPLYGSTRVKELTVAGEPFSLRFPFGPVTGSLRSLELDPRRRAIFVDQQEYFGSRSGLYHEGGREYGDNHRRFAYLGAASLYAAQRLGFQADVVHANDWQTGLCAAALEKGYAHTALGAARRVFTIHNLAYQGTFEKGVMNELGLPWELFTPQGLEQFDQVSFLKAGLAYSDAITTVSPRYAQEILTPEGGQGLDGYLRERKDRLFGILNGVDYEEWTPWKDPFLPAPFSAEELAGKELCKKEALFRFGLNAGDLGPPVFGVVTRLVEQKGVDLLLGVLPWLLSTGARVVLVGSGEGHYEHALWQLKEAFPHGLGLHLGFSNELAHLVEAGSDFFLMPSLFEPCGLNQMYSLRYGAIPVVRATGGLDDTVVDLSQKLATGVKFTQFSTDAFGQAVGRALELYKAPGRLIEVRRRGMGGDFSWERAARAYEAVYRAVPALPRSR